MYDIYFTTVVWLRGFSEEQNGLCTTETVVKHAVVVVATMEPLEPSRVPHVLAHENAPPEGLLSVMRP